MTYCVLCIYHIPNIKRCKKNELRKIDCKNSYYQNCKKYKKIGNKMINIKQIVTSNRLEYEILNDSLNITDIEFSNDRKHLLIISGIDFKDLKEFMKSLN